MTPTQQESAAIEAFALGCTVPLLLRTELSIDLHASGTLFESHGQQFIVTAAHIFDGLTRTSQLVVPVSAGKGSLIDLEGLKVYLSEPDDVALIELTDCRVRAILSEGWRFLSTVNISGPTATESDSAFFLTGYPGSETHKQGDWLFSKGYTIYSQRILDAASAGALSERPGIDLFFEFGHTAVSLTGGSVSTPDLPGVSGASVWELKTPSEGVWAPELVASVVGIQSSVHRENKFFRAKSWIPLARLFEQVDRDLALAVRKKLEWPI